ncbi:hypothetical protein B484DRAFT_467735 [Ochromonadaceae sp. CCMP2298]|nr:hypothetical protein B484DRAFT_467735 [Ochromonadaceae sp. CCMP2298]
MAKFRASLLAASSQSSFGAAAPVPPSVPAGAVPPEALGSTSGLRGSSTPRGELLTSTLTSAPPLRPSSAIEDINEYSGSEYDDAPLSSRAKARTSAAKAPAGASHPPTPDLSSARLAQGHEGYPTTSARDLGDQALRGGSLWAGHPTLDNVPISALSLPTLASTDPRMLTRYYTSHGIICDYLDFSRLPPDVFTSTKAYSDEAWMEENFSQEFELDRVVRYTTAGDQYDDQVQTVIARARVLGKDYMPLDCMIFNEGNEGNEHAMLHLGGHYPRLLVIFPTYYEVMGGDFYIYMACHGGLYPDPVGAPPLVSSTSTLLVPCANHAWSVFKVRDPAPPTFLLGNAPRPALHDADAFTIYIGEMAKVQLTDSDRADAYERFEARDTIESPLLSEHDFVIGDGPIDTSPASSRKFISPRPFSHPCFAAILGVKVWRSDPTVSAFINMAATSSTAVTMDSYAIYRIIHRTDPSQQPLQITEAAARFHAGVKQHLSAQPQVDFRLPAVWTTQRPPARSDPIVVDIAAQEDAEIAELTSPTSLDRQASPSAIEWELNHAPSQHNAHFTDDTFAFSAGSGSDPEQGVGEP